MLKEAWYGAVLCLSQLFLFPFIRSRSISFYLFLHSSVNALLMIRVEQTAHPIEEEHHFRVRTDVTALAALRLFWPLYFALRLLLRAVPFRVLSALLCPFCMFC